MRKTLLTIALLSAALVSAQSTWKSDRAHSKIGFAINHLMISEIEGHFSDFEVTATGSDTFGDASFEVTIKTTSINTDVEPRDKHLRSADFFDAEKFPEITFKSSGYEQTGMNTFRLTGDLTMHGVTKTVVLDGRVNGVITDQRSKKLKAGLKLTGAFSRMDFGVGTGFPPAALGTEVRLTAFLEMAQQ